jgi:hypothetical protein
MEERRLKIEAKINSLLFEDFKISLHLAFVAKGGGFLSHGMEHGENLLIFFV